MRHGPRAFVEQLDFRDVARPRRRPGANGARSACATRRAGAARDRPLHDAAGSGDARSSTWSRCIRASPRAGRARIPGGPMRFAPHVDETAAPTADELDALRDLKPRTAARTASRRQNRIAATDFSTNEANHDAIRPTSAGSQPPLLYPPYKSTIRRAPAQPLIRLPETMSRPDRARLRLLPVGETDNDLTRQHAGEPQGERIIVAGPRRRRGRPAVPHTLVEIWQATPPAATGTRRTITRRRSIRISAAPAAR